MEWRREPVDVGEVIDRATAATASLLDRRPGRRLGRRASSRPAGGHRRPRPAHPGRDQPHLERGQVHADRARSPARPERRPARTAGEVVVAVADTGIGIAPEDQATVFEQFGQAGDTLTDRPRGTGLGCRSAARSSSTTAAGCGSNPRSGAGRRSRSACRSRRRRLRRSHGTTNQASWRRLRPADRAAGCGCPSRRRLVAHPARRPRGLPVDDLEPGRVVEDLHLRPWKRSPAEPSPARRLRIVSSGSQSGRAGSTYSRDPRRGRSWHGSRTGSPRTGRSTRRPTPAARWRPGTGPGSCPRRAAGRRTARAGGWPGSARSPRTCASATWAASAS